MAEAALRIGLAALAPALLACADDPPAHDLEALRDPATCAGCHPEQHASWAASAHAHASEDPVFRAMNARGQRETDGALGDFCVRCHAPVAVALGETTDGTNLDALPQHLQGVGCAWCHGVTAVTGDDNAALEVRFDGVMRGGLVDADAPDVHDVAYSPLLDRNDPRSSAMCGACHDVVTPVGLHLERTFAEWEQTVFAEEGPAFQGCGHCHMPSAEGPIAAVPGARARRVHDHAMVGVDVPLVEAPSAEALAPVQALLDTSLVAELCVNPSPGGVEISLSLENALAGHDFPSGASFDRRVWVELVAVAGDQVLLETGVVGDDEPLVEGDPELWALHDLARDGAGRLVHDFWEAEVLEERALVGASPAPGGGVAPHAARRSWTVAGALPDRVDARVRLRPFGLDILDDLVATGDLDPAVRHRVPTYDLGSTVLSWTGPLGSCVR